MSDREALGAFLDKWRTRWPEWRIAEAFVPPPQRAATLAWLALRQELADAAWEGADPRPGAAKLAWWSDELHGWAQGRRRHPLGLELQRIEGARWDALAEALPLLAAARDALPAAGSGVTASHAALAPFASAAGAISAALAGESAPAPAPASGDRAAALASGLSAMRALAGSGDTAAAAALLAGWPARPAGTRADRIFTALARQRLRALAAPRRNRTPSSWHTLWVAWQAGRSFPSA